jgi:hypothetical protein
MTAIRTAYEVMEVLGWIETWSIQSPR